MKRHRHAPEQSLRKVREGERLLNEGTDLTEVLRHLEISDATWNRWRAIFLISRRSGKVNVGGRPPTYLDTSESKPSSLKLWITARTRSGEVNATWAIWATSMPWADSSPIWALRHVTTDPEDRRTILSRRLPAVAHVTSSVEKPKF